MKKGNYLSTILKSEKTVFTFKDIALLWGDSKKETSRVRVNYYVKKGDLYRIRRGFYAKDKNYDKFEFATKIFTPAYISFETVLGRSGLTFQYYSQIFIASYLTRELKIDGEIFSYRKIKDVVLTNEGGIESVGEYSIASKERAFLDTLYLNKKYYFDNLNPLDWEKVFKIMTIYSSKRVEKTVEKLYKNLKKEEK
jgi:predicted transcriptional regulator of viral defense system